jgi:hypothetical protein
MTIDLNAGVVDNICGRMRYPAAFEVENYDTYPAA